MGHPVFYVTTPIYYPSDRLHVGHAYTTVAADAIARYHRLKGEAVWFVTGTDEHGQKIQRRAEEAHLSPLDFVTAIVQQIKDPLWKRLGISYDDFIRTTEPRHAAVVRQVFRELQERGDIYKGHYEGWYCLPDETFWPESKLIGGNCPDCGRPVERVRQESYFFRLSRYQSQVCAHIEAHPEFVQPESRRNEMLGFLDEGLEDLSISRTGLSWGIPVPGDESHVIYVWFDALINYLTSAGYGSDPGRFDATWPPNVQIMAKEIVRFHAIIWPAMLLALGLALPDRVLGHGWLLMNDTKMSKSRGNVVDPLVLIDRYGVDAVRYYLLREVPLGADGNYTEDALVLRTNVDLANDFGNLVNRTVAMISRFLGGTVERPEPPKLPRPLPQAAARALLDYRQAMDDARLADAIRAVNQLVREANRYIESSQPWALRGPATAGQLAAVLWDLAETLRCLSVLLTPFLIEAPRRLRAQIGLTAPVGHLDEARFGAGPNRYTVAPEAPLFPRIEGRLASEPPPGAPISKAEAAVRQDGATIDLADFQRVDLRVVTIRSAEPVAGADRLLRLAVDDGERLRTVVAGIRAHYAPEDLIGAQAVLVANLRPAKIRGIVSEGMLLAASANGELALVAPRGRSIPPGSRVK